MSANSTTAGERDQVLPPFFPVSSTKLIVMTICTLGLYELQWFYQHWWAIKRRTGERISPIWRTHFLILFCTPLFRRIRAEAEARGLQPGFSPGMLAGIYLALLFLAATAEELWAIALLSHLPLVVVQRTANEINRMAAPQADRNERFSRANKAAVFFGGLILFLAALSLFASG